MSGSCGGGDGGGEGCNGVVGGERCGCFGGGKCGGDVVVRESCNGGGDQLIMVEL